MAEEFTVDQRMADLGYRYKLIPTGDEHPPCYTEELAIFGVLTPGAGDTTFATVCGPNYWTQVSFPTADAVDRALASQGYRYKFQSYATGSCFLYAKELICKGDTKLSGRLIQFQVVSLRANAHLVSLLRMWRNGQHQDVARTLKNAEPGLTASFIAEGLSSGVIYSADINGIAGMFNTRC